MHANPACDCLNVAWPTDSGWVSSLPVHAARAADIDHLRATLALSAILRTGVWAARHFLALVWVVAAEADEALLAPVRSPRVLDQPVVQASLFVGAVANKLHN